MTQAKFLGDLDPQAHPVLSTRDEIRKNLIEKEKRGAALFPGIVGYADTVIPQVINALLARHDLILLGLRGQAKTRLARLLTELLDPEVPVIPGCPLRSHPLAPVSRYAQERVEAEGKGLPIDWLTREERYHEKLATPDVSMADLIGDLDPLKAAHEKLSLADERVINYGLIPRSNRGLFCVNELPDLAPRIQVGLLNILEEQDVQIRGFPLRFNLDVVMIFTANPEDYTNRGSIITPLKDRIATQILTHYPKSLDDARAITHAEVWSNREHGVEVVIPEFVDDIVEGIAFEGRDSEYVDQTSGVSARLSIAARELLISQVERRAFRDGKSRAVARVTDLMQLIPAVTGKIELVYEGEQEGVIEVARRLIGQASQAVFDRHFPDVIEEGREGSQVDRYKPVLDWFSAGNTIELADDMSDEEYAEAIKAIPGLDEIVREIFPESEEDERVVAKELVLEGLFLHSLLTKQNAATGATYTDMFGSMIEGLR